MLLMPMSLAEEQFPVTVFFCIFFQNMFAESSGSMPVAGSKMKQVHVMDRHGLEPCTPPVDTASLGTHKRHEAAKGRNQAELGRSSCFLVPSHRNWEGLFHIMVIFKDMWCFSLKNQTKICFHFPVSFQDDLFFLNMSSSRFFRSLCQKYVELYPNMANLT